MTTQETPLLVANPSLNKVNEEEKQTRFQVVFNIGKKLLDLGDDFWNLGRSFIGSQIVSAVSPFLIGSIFFLIHLGEGYEAAKEAYKAAKDKHTPQRKTKITKSTVVMMAAGTGFGLAITYFVSGFGVEVLGQAVFPVVIPALLTGIYVLNLFEALYSLSQIKLKEAETAYLDALADLQSAEVLFRQELQQIHQKKAKWIADLAQWETNSANIEAPVFEMKKKEITDALQDLNTLEKTLHDNFKSRVATFEMSKTNLIAKQEERLAAERKVAFSILELIGSAIVVTGIALSTTGFIALLAGGSVASFGALPLALLILGVGIGFAAKVFEWRDEKNDHRYTKAIREKLTHFLPFLKPFTKTASFEMKEDNENDFQCTTSRLLSVMPEGTPGKTFSPELEPVLSATIPDEEPTFTPPRFDPTFAPASPSMR